MARLVLYCLTLCIEPSTTGSAPGLPSGKRNPDCFPPYRSTCEDFVWSLAAPGKSERQGRRPVFSS